MQKIASYHRPSLRDNPGLFASVFPQIIRGILQDHIHTILAVAVSQQVLHHHVVFLSLAFVPRARFRHYTADVPDRGHELFLYGLFQRFVAQVADL